MDSGFDASRRPGMTPIAAKTRPGMTERKRLLCVCLLVHFCYVEPARERSDDPRPLVQELRDLLPLRRLLHGCQRRRHWRLQGLDAPPGTHADRGMVFPGVQK